MVFYISKLIDYSSSKSFFLKAFLIFLVSLSVASGLYSDTIHLNKWEFYYSFDSSSTENYNFRRVEVPHSFNLNESLGAHKSGYGCYRNDIKLEFEDKFDYLLEFDGVCLRAEIFIDNEIVNKIDKAYLPFRLKINRFLEKKNEINLIVKVENKLLHNNMPDNNCDGWWIYGGLIRDVRIVRLPKVRIDNLQIRTWYLGKNRFKTTCNVKRFGQQPDSIKINIFNKDDETVFKKVCNYSIDSLYEFIVEGVKSWCPKSPYLYTFEITPYWNGKTGEIIRCRRGFSQLYANKGELFLNGKPIFLRGIGRHDVIGKKGPLLTRNERCADLIEIKSTGANLLRIAHFPQHKEIYELCDSIGLLVMDEIPAWKTYPGFLGDSTGQRFASEYMDVLINSHGNYSCIGIWCIGNEISSVKKRVADYVKCLSGFTRKKDPSRLVTYTSYFYQFDKAYQYVDVVSINEYFGWYLGSVDMIPSMLISVKKECPDKPIIISEFGASAAMGVKNPAATLAGPVKSVITKDYSEDYQALFHEKQIETIWKCRKICKGAVVWCYNDFMENRKKPHSKKLNKGLNGMGLVTESRKHKDAFHVVKNSFLNIKNLMEKEGGY